MCKLLFMAPSSVEEVEERLQHIKIGGEELILSTKDNRHLELLSLICIPSSSAVQLETRIRTSFEAAVT